MKIKNSLKVIGIVIIIAISIGIYKLSTFSLFDDEFKVLEQVNIPNKEYKLKIYYIPSNASSQSYIQIRKIENRVEEVLVSYERFNYLKNYELTKDSIILFVSDTSKTDLVSIQKLKLP